MISLPLLAASDWGLAFAIGVMMLVFLLVGYVVIQGTRVQLAWRESVEAGDVDAIRVMVSDELKRWKAIRMPKGTEPGVWHGIQSAELLDVAPDGVRVSALAEGQFSVIDEGGAPGASPTGQRREVSNSYHEGIKLTARLADMLLYDIPNARLPWVQVDIYSTYRDDQGSSQRCIMSTRAERAVAETIDWDGMEPQEIVDAFGGRYSTDARGNALPIEVDTPARGSVPAVFYEDED